MSVPEDATVECSDGLAGLPPSCPPISEAVLALARRMIVQLGKPLKTTVPITDPRVRLKAFSTPFSSPDSSGHMGHQWPASRLTGDDRRRLSIIGNYARLPTSEVLHLAVGVLYEQTRALMLQLLELHEQTGCPFVDLLEYVGDTSPVATPQVAAPSRAVNQTERNAPRLPFLPHPIQQRNATESPGGNGAVRLAAETSPAGPPVQRFFPFDEDGQE